MPGGLFAAASVLVLITLEALAAWVTGSPTCGCLPCVLTHGNGGAFIPSNSGPLPEGMKRVCLLASRRTQFVSSTCFPDMQCTGMLSPGRLVLPSGCMLLLEALVKLCIKVHSSTSSCAREGFTPSMRLPHSHSHTVLTVHAPTGILPR
jgi:hypothetical protein